MQEAPILRMFGITKGGNSVAIHVHNFTPYFYVKVNPQLLNPSPEDLTAIKDLLNKIQLPQSGHSEHPATPVKAIELVKDKASVMNYQQDKATFLKIYTGVPKYVNQLRSMFENGNITYPRGA